MKITGDEKKIEPKLVKLIESKGGKCIKFPASFFNGFPDRICLLPGGKIFFVETKSKGDNPKPIQRSVHRMLRNLGFRVYIINCESQFEQLKIDEFDKC